MLVFQEQGYSIGIFHRRPETRFRICRKRLYEFWLYFSDLWIPSPKIKLRGWCLQENNGTPSGGRNAYTRKCVRCLCNDFLAYFPILKNRVDLWDHVGVCVCGCVSPVIVPRQRLGRNVTAVTNTYATVEELLDASFSLWLVPYQGK
jgi:hypothetical protein